MKYKGGSTEMNEYKTPKFSAEVRQQFINDVDDLEKRAREYTADYLADPNSVTQAQLRGLITDTYLQTVAMFDEEIREGDALLPYEQEIYDLCKREIDAGADRRLKGVLSAFFSSIELIRDCIDAIRDMFGLCGDADKADAELKKAGNAVLPSYATTLSKVFVTIADFFSPPLVPTIYELSRAQIDCALKYQGALTINKTLCSNMVNVASYAYGDPPKPSEPYTKLTATEIPQSVKALYNEGKGLLTSTGGLAVWLGKSGDNIAVAFSGTDPTNMSMLYADVAQLSQASVLYLKAAGLLKILLDANPGKNFYVTGHSLGGGLTQFALTANITGNESRLTGFAFNTAGLSGVSLDHLTSGRLNKAKQRVYVFLTYHDPVSLLGGKIGCMTTLPQTTNSGHGITCVREGFDAYMKIVSGSFATIRMSLKNNSSDDFIPYTKTLSISDSGGNNYPLFSSSPGGASEFKSFDIPKALFDELAIPKNVSDCVLGVYNKFNGTAHTVINRLLLMRDGMPDITTDSIGNIHSSIIYGKFGLGIKDFIDLFEKQLGASGLLPSMNRSGYELMLGYIRNPYDYDSTAWFTGIKIQFGIDVPSLFPRYPYAERTFREFLIKLTADRVDLYNEIANRHTVPTEQDKKDFITRYKALALTAVDDLMGEAVRWSIISPAQRIEFYSEADRFASRVVNGV
jgi:hypothetical protein